jgi:F0F1-type ATP synthase membrane subunit c/vacuolar-type H+-ATPase subunit K
MSKLDLAMFGRPRPEHHHKVRSALSVAAAIAGGLGVIGLAFAIVGSISPGEAVVLYTVVIVLLAIWVTGIWWRWDSPDARDRQSERERRGF